MKCGPHSGDGREPAKHHGSAEQFTAVQGIARILTKRGQFDDALSALRKVDLDKLGVIWRDSIRLSVGDTLRAAGRNDEALTAYKTIINDPSADLRLRKLAESKIGSPTKGNP